MIQVRASKMHRSKVYTRSGSYLGRLDDLVLDIDQGKITALLVAPSGLIKKFLDGDLIIAIDQVIEFSPKKIIVEDSVVKESGRKVKAFDYRIGVSTDAGPIISSDQ